MSKSKNRKRSKMLRQRKKEREKEIISQTDNNIHGLDKIKKRLDKELNADVKFNYDNNAKDRKISDVVSEMIQPLMEEARTFDEEKTIIGLGVMAWNLGVVMQNKGEREVRRNIKSIGKELPKQFKDVIVEYSKIKCENYSGYNELIVDYEFSRLNDNQNNLTVSYKSINE